MYYLCLERGDPECGLTIFQLFTYLQWGKKTLNIILPGYVH